MLMDVLNTKENALKIIGEMPSDCTIEDIMYNLYIQDKVNQGLMDFDVGNVFSNEEIKSELNEWLR
jgi:predicted transcriptional regulator